MKEFPIHYTQSVLGGKWKIIILCFLNEGVKRNGELKRLIPGISQKVLTEQLRELEKDGLVDRTVFNVVPPHVEYSLSKHGDTLKPILNAMREWGEEHQDTRGE